MRYEILYRHGGIYLDTDFELFKNITSLLTHDLVVCNEDANNDSYITNAFIASSKGNLNMKRCVDNIFACKINEGRVNFETGPSYFRKHLQFDETVRTLPTNAMYPVHFSNKNNLLPTFSDETYGMHHWAFSWG